MRKRQGWAQSRKFVPQVQLPCGRCCPGKDQVLEIPPDPALGLHVVYGSVAAEAEMRQAALLESEVMHIESVTRLLLHSPRPNRYLAVVAVMWVHMRA